jgi:hypothetical protein
MGDVKFATLCGVLTGAGGVVAMTLVTFATGGLVAGAVLVGRIRGRRDAIALTPFMTIGVLVTLAWRGGYLLQ